MLLYDAYPPAIKTIVRLVKHQPISHLLVIYPFWGWLYNYIPILSHRWTLANLLGTLSVLAGSPHLEIG